MATKKTIKSFIDRITTERPKPLTPRAGQRLDPKTKYGNGGKVSRKKSV